MALTATFAASFDQFTSSLNKASVQLYNFDRATKTATRDLQREVNAFSGQKIAVEAERMAQAIHQVEGVSKLTSTEIARAVPVIGEYVAKLKALGQEVPPHIAKLNAELNRVGPASENASVGFGKLVASFVTAQAVIGVVKSLWSSYTGLISSSIESFAQAELAMSRVNAALRAQGTATPETRKQFAQLADQFERTTVFADDLIMEMQALLVQVGDVAPSQMKQALTAATDLASGLGIDLRTATMLVGKAFEGETGTLKRYGIVIDETKLKTQGITAVLDAVQQKFGGQAAAEVDTYSGQIKQLANQWDNLKERIGQFALSSRAVEGSLNILNQLLQDMSRESGPATTAVGKLWDVWQNYITIGQTVTPGLSAIHRWLGDIADSAEGSANAVDHAAESLLRFKRSIEGQALKPLTMDMRTYNLTMEELNISAAKLIEQNIAETQRKTTVTTRGLAVATTELLKVTRMFTADVRAVTIPGNMQWLATMAQLSPALSDAASKVNILEATLPPLAASTDIASRGFEQLKGAVQSALEGAGATGGMFSAIGDNLKSVFATIPQLLTQAFTGGGGLVGAFKAIGTQLADAIAAPIIAKLSTLQKAAVGAGAGLAGALGGASGGATIGAIGSIAGGLGGAAVSATAWGIAMGKAGVAGAIALGATTAGIGLAVVGVALLIKKYATVSKEIKEARKHVQEFQEALHQTLTTQQLMEADGRSWAATLIAVRDVFKGIGRSATEAELVVAALLNTDNPKAAAAAMNEINAAIKQMQKNMAAAAGIFDDILGEAGNAGGIPDFLRPYIEQMIELGLLTADQAKALRALGDSGATNWAKVKEAADKYGVRLESLGPAFNAQRIATDAAGIVNAFNLIVNAGGDVGGVLFDMQDEISKIVNDAKKFGTTIPENMKPWIDELMRAGLLVDENGEKITDLGGIKYGDKIKTEAEKSREAFEKIVEKIQELIDKLTGPLQAAIAAIPDEIRIKAGVDWDPGTGPREIGGRGPDESGPYGSRSASMARPASSALGGRVSSALARSSSGGGVYHVHVDLEGRQVTEVVINHLGQRLSVRGGR